MSDRANPDVENKAGDVDDDPLAELARIVAGEEDAEANGHAGSGSDGIAVSDMDLQLEEALGKGLEADTAPEVPSAAQESVDQAMDQHMAELEQAFAAPAGAEQPTEGTFEDGLISALQDEISPEAQHAEQSVDDALASELSEQFEEPPAAVEVAEQTVPAQDQPVYSNHAPGTTTALDDDLGAAFDNEFQQILSVKKPEVAASLSAAQPEIAVQEQATSLEQAMEQEITPEEQAMPVAAAPQSVSQASSDADQGTVALQEDLDFGSAFAEELGLDHIEPEQGWESSDTEAAQAEFNRSATGESASAVQADPVQAANTGTSGTIPNPAVSRSVAPKNGSLKYALAAMILALFGGTIAAGYGFLGGGDAAAVDGEPTIIKADEGPVKVKPDDPGGRVVANQDKASYDQVQGQDQENLDQETLISNTEEPAKIEKPSNADVAALPGVETNLPPKTADRLESEADASGSGSQALGDVKPRVVRTVTVKPDGTIIQNEPEPQQVTGLSSGASANQVPGTESGSGQSTSAVTTTQSGSRADSTASTDTIDGAISTDRISIPEASPLPKPAQPVANETVQSVAIAEPEPEPAPAPAPAPVSQSEWVVQVSSQRSQDAAEASFRNMQSRFGSLQGRSMAIQQANVNGSTYYRVRVQTASRDDANQLCANLKASGGSCFVTR